MDGEVIDMPEPEPIEPTLAVIQHPLDTSDPIPVRTRPEILKEAVLLVPNVAKLLFRLLGDRRVPLGRRLSMAAIAAYVASPVDLIPDYIPVVGGLDDVLLLAFAVDYLLSASPEEVITEHWDGSEDALELVRGISGWGVELLPERFRRLFADGGRRP